MIEQALSSPRDPIPRIGTLLASLEVEDSESTAMPADGSGQTKMNESPRILIVDDEAVVRRSFDRLLSSAQCHTRTANDGAGALDAMSREPFDVVLLDLRMPGEDGISVLRRIKAGWPRSEVVVITGYPTIESAKQAVRAGACDYLAKPIEPRDMIYATRRALSRQRWIVRRLPDTGTKTWFCNEGENNAATSQSTGR